MDFLVMKLFYRMNLILQKHRTPFVWVRNMERPVRKKWMIEYYSFLGLQSHRYTILLEPPATKPPANNPSAVPKQIEIMMINNMMISFY